MAYWPPNAVTSTEHRASNAWSSWRSPAVRPLLKAGAPTANGAKAPNDTMTQAPATAAAWMPGPTLIQKPTKGSMTLAKQEGSQLSTSFWCGCLRLWDLMSKAWPVESKAKTTASESTAAGFEPWTMALIATATAAAFSAVMTNNEPTAATCFGSRRSSPRIHSNAPSNNPSTANAKSSNTAPAT